MEQQQKQDKNQVLAQKVTEEMVSALGNKEFELISTRAALAAAQDEINELRARLNQKEENKKEPANK